MVSLSIFIDFEVGIGNETMGNILCSQHFPLELLVGEGSLFEVWESGVEMTFCLCCVWRLLRDK